MWLLCMYTLSVTMFVLYTFVITIYVYVCRRNSMYVHVYVCVYVCVYVLYVYMCVYCNFLFFLTSFHSSSRYEMTMDWCTWAVHF